MELVLNQVQTRSFVMIDSSGVEVAGLGNTFTLEISKNGGAFAPSTGTKSEISDGWYAYEFTAAETDTEGELSVKVTGAGCIQQNLVYLVAGGNTGCLEFTYTATNAVTLLPIQGAQIWVSTDLAHTHIVWSGITDVFGVLRDGFGNLPCLDPGTYYFWKQIAGLIDDDNPDIEIVS